MPRDWKRSLPERPWELLALLAFMAVATLLWWHHEPWRDEAQAWLIARDVPSLGALIELMRYEGSPALWHLLLLPLAKAGAPFWTMGVLHLAIISGAVFLLLRYSPFSFPEKVLAASGYFFLYQYSALARNYSLTVLLLFAAAALHPRRFERPVLYVVPLALLANANVHSLLLSGLFGLLFAYELLVEHRGSVPPRAMRAAGAVLLLAWGAAVYQVRTPPDLAPWLVGWNTDLSRAHFADIARSLADAFLPFHPDRPDFWYNTAFQEEFDRHTGEGESAAAFGMVALAVGLFALSVWLLRRDRKLMLLYLTASTALLSLFFLKYVGYIRHHGIIFILFLALVWMHRAADTAPRPRGRLWRGRPRRELEVAFLVGLLAIQVIALPATARHEIEEEFTAGPAAARYLQENGLLGDDVLIATFPSPPPTSILPHLPREHSRFYFLEYMENRSYMVWNASLGGPAYDGDGLIRQIDLAVGDATYRKVLLITNLEPQEPAFTERTTLLQRFPIRVIHDEGYRIYEVHPRPAGP